MAKRMDGFYLEGVAHEERGYSGLRFTAAGKEREGCGNPGCAGGWLASLKDRRRGVFEGRWGCTAKCIETMVKTAVRREAGEEATEEGQEVDRHRMPLGLILLAQRWITNPQLQHALDRQRRTGRGLIGQWLTEECGLDSSRITRGLGAQWGCPVLPMEGFDPERMALAAPRLLVEQLGMVPLRMVGKRTLQLAFAERLDASAALAMERISGLKVESGLVDLAQWKDARRRLGACDFVDADFNQVAGIEVLPGRIAAVMNKMQPVASRLVRVHRFYWLRMWLEPNAMLGGVPWTREDVVDRLYAVGTEE